MSPLNPFALEWYPSPSSSPEATSFIQQIAALDNLSLDDFYEVRIRICGTRPGTFAPLLLLTLQCRSVASELRRKSLRRSRAVLLKSATVCRRGSAALGSVLLLEFSPNCTPLESRSECSVM